MVKQSIEANNGKKLTYKIIIIDYDMPMLSGLDTFFKIDALLDENNIKAKPVIVCLSAYNKTSYKEKVIKAGMDGFFPKPFNRRDLDKLLKMSNIKQSKLQNSSDGGTGG
mmetsp:Transcript_39029/g.53009  ORF Transcript_39029/g.53009 Transcript_39029/m.53009 type:complete len:110 (-) Transcript_39029:126-455(-)